VRSEQDLESVELLVNGVVRERFEAQNRRTPEGARETVIRTVFTPDSTSWVAWRCFERLPGDRLRFAHTAAWRFVKGDEPMRPRREEAEWLVGRVKEEIQRSQSVVPEELMQSYRRALAVYESMAARAR
jgi:hypothetical protein